MKANTESLHDAVELASVISTGELIRRPARLPDHAGESRALVALAQAMSNSPERILQQLVEAAMTLCRAQSAGISLLDAEKGRFLWPAIAGAWSMHVGIGTPRDFGPCGTVLDRREALLFSRPERCFGYLSAVTPRIDEALLIPFYVGGEPVGTLWVVAHDESRRFDSEDMRVLTSLGTFAGLAYQTLRSLDSERTARAEADAASRAKSDFLSSMSHELRTPLNAIGGYAQLMEMGLHGPVTTAQREVLGRITDSERHVLRLVNGLLDLARIEAGKNEYTSAEIFLAEVFEGVVPMVELQLARKRLTMDSSIAPDLAVRGDTEKIKQILLNLLVNAVKFTAEGGQITAAGTADANSNRVSLTISDTGIGIAENKLAAIFEPFRKLADKNLNPDGAGLGLTLSREFARGMGGDVLVRSELGRGSTFTLVLPGV